MFEFLDCRHPGMSLAARRLLGLFLAGGSCCAVADWAGFSDYAAIAELRVEAATVRWSVRIREEALPYLATRLGRGSESASPEWLAGHLLQIRLASGEKPPGADQRASPVDTRNTGHSGPRWFDRLTTNGVESPRSS